MNIRKATLNDIDILIKLRLAYLSADQCTLSVGAEKVICNQLASFYPKHMNQDFIAMLAEIGDTVVSTAFLSISELPANPSFITGKTEMYLLIRNIAAWVLQLR